MSAGEFEIIIPDEPDALIIGLFDPESLGQGMKATGMSAQEMVITLSEQIRNGKPHDQREAISLLQRLAKDAVQLSGQVATARIESTDDDGNVHVLTAQRVLTALKTRPTLGKHDIVETAPYREQVKSVSNNVPGV